MTKLKPAINQFNGGEISPQLEGRFDWDKYNYSSRLCKNFIPLVEGSLKRRGGTHFVNTTEGTPVFRVRFVFTYNDSTTPKNIEARIDDTSFVISELEYETIVRLGEQINYNFYVNGYIGKSGEIEVLEDVVIPIEFINISDAVSLKITTDPEDSTCIMNGVETKELIVERGSEVEVLATYNNHTETEYFTVSENTEKRIIVKYVAYQSYYFEKAEEVLLNRGEYHVWAVAGSGGAGGGTYGDGRKSTGAGGGSGAFYNGYMLLDGKYTIDVGIWGQGGYSGRDKKDAGDGGDGSETIIYDVLYLGGGTGGARGGGKGSPDYEGKGGVARVLNPEIVLTEPINGNDAKGSVGGESPSGKSKYNGGSGVYKKTGQPGYGGGVKITYVGKWS